MKFYVKIHEDPLEKEKKVVAITDENLIGKEFSEGDMKFKVKERFYKGDLLSKEEAMKKIEEANVLNITGEKSVSMAVQEEKVKEEDILKIDGIPHAQSVVVKED